MLQDDEKELSRNLSEKFRQFLILHSPSAFSRRLRQILLEYLIHRQRTGFPVNFNIWLLELSDLFDLLDTATDEWELQKVVDDE